MDSLAKRAYDHSYRIDPSSGSCPTQIFTSC